MRRFSQNATASTEKKCDFARKNKKCDFHKKKTVTVTKKINFYRKKIRNLQQKKNRQEFRKRPSP